MRLFDFTLFINAGIKSRTDNELSGDEPLGSGVRCFDLTNIRLPSVSNITGMHTREYLYKVP